MKQFPILFLLLLILASCHKQQNNEEKIRALIESSESFGLELPSPVIPDSIQDADAKRIYAGVHFWDGLDFNDTLRSLNDAFLEQNFANFIVYLEAQPNEEAVENAFLILLSKASSEPRALDKINYIIRLYLAEPNSPLRSEDLWISYLKVMTSNQKFSKESEIERYEHQLVMDLKNRPGNLAEDFKSEIISFQGKSFAIFRYSRNREHS